ncbi:MAG: hypothetical protein CVT60_03260 [Actinobacteria bacterium HGW-Actinobacteria-10]|jgi:hypothetical protein|nr:MAG: hypothetical protein CVT60_03260 [Actinobacteria bacterium HGW-Actinobacteria-10]
MKHSKRYYDELADRLAAGQAAPGDPETLVRFTRTIGSTEEQVGSADELLVGMLASEAAAQNAAGPVGHGPVPLVTDTWRRRAMISTFLSTLFGKIALATVATAVAATGAAAATGNLPDPAQQAVSEAFAKAGISVPAPEESDSLSEENQLEGSREASAPVLADEASDKAKGVTDSVFSNDPAAGREFGDGVSGTASDGAVDAVPSVEGSSAAESATDAAKSQAPAAPALPDSSDAGAINLP